jgi:P-type conjugative transfer protein TrbL
MSAQNLDDIATQFYTAGVHYSAAIQPYALKLLVSLFLLEILVTWIQYSAEGQLDPTYYFGRSFRHLMTSGFIYLMITNGFQWMYLIIQSFSRIGSALTGLPSLSPQSVLDTGVILTNMLLSSPATTGLLNNLELAIVSGAITIIVLAAFLIVAVELMMTLVKFYLTASLGILLLGFGGNRSTASAAEGYFTHVIRIGTKILFFYAVLGIGMQMVAQWQEALTAACAPEPTTVSMIHSYYVPPSTMVVTACTATISIKTMILFMSLSVVFCALCVAVPSMAAELVGGVAGLGLAHMFEAAYTANTIARIITPLSQGLKKVSDGINSLAPTAQPQRHQFAMHDTLKSAKQQSDALTVTKPLNPCDAPEAVQAPKVRPLKTSGNATAAMAQSRSTTKIGP